VVKIVTDTLSDLPASLIKELGISVVPLNLHFGTEVYRDTVDITTDVFYQKLMSKQVFPTTSAPGPGIFVELYNQLAKETDAIVAIMTSRKISAVGESAMQAKNMVKLDARIEVIDTQQVAGALMLVVITAAEAAKAGANFEQVVSLVKDTVQRTHVRMAFDTLEYLRRGGRIGKAQALLGSLLKIHPVLGLKDGEAFPHHRARNRAGAVDFLVNFARGFAKIEKMVVEDATTPQEADDLVDRLAAFYPKERIYRAKVSPVFGAHVGPHVLDVAIIEGKKEAGDIPVPAAQKAKGLSPSPAIL